MTWRDVEPTWNLVIGALSVFQLDCLSTIRVSCFFVIWDCVQVFVGYEPGLLFVRILNPVPRMSWLACVWKTVIRLPMFPVTLRAIEPQIETSMVSVWIRNDKFTRVLNEEV